MPLGGAPGGAACFRHSCCWLHWQGRPTGTQNQQHVHIKPTARRRPANLLNKQTEHKSTKAASRMSATLLDRKQLCQGVHMYTHICLYVCMYVCMYVRTYVRMYVCMCVYVCACIFKCTSRWMHKKPACGPQTMLFGNARCGIIAVKIQVGCINYL